MFLYNDNNNNYYYLSNSEFMTNEVPMNKYNKEIFEGFPPNLKGFILDKMNKKLNEIITVPENIANDDNISLTALKSSQTKYFSNQTKSTHTNNINDFFYYQTDNYKNYKYKLYNIDMDEIERKRLLGKKIFLSDYNYPSDLLKEQQKLKKILKIKKIKETRRDEKIPSKHIPDNSSKLTIMNKINKLSMDLKIDSFKISRKQENKPIVKSNENMQNNKSISLPFLEQSKITANRAKDADNLLNDRLMGMLTKKKNELPSLNLSKKNESVLELQNQEENIKYKKKIGGGFTLIINKKENQRKKNKSMNHNEHILEKNNSLKTMNDQIGEIIQSKKIKKNKNVSDFKFKQKNNRSIYEEFIYLSKITKESIITGDEGN